MPRHQVTLKLTPAVKKSKRQTTSHPFAFELREKGGGGGEGERQRERKRERERGGGGVLGGCSRGKREGLRKCFLLPEGR